VRNNIKAKAKYDMKVLMMEDNQFSSFEEKKE